MLHLHMPLVCNHVRPSVYRWLKDMAALKRRPEAFQGLLLAVLGLPLVLLVSNPQKIWDYTAHRWQLLGEICSQQWAVVYRATGENDWMMYVIGSWLVPFIIFCFLNIVLGCLDFAGKFSVLHRYKIQQDKNVPMEWKRYLQTAGLAGFNMTVVTVALTASLWPVARWRVSCGYELPAPLTLAWQLVLCVLIEEAGFYYMHRAMHQVPLLYKYIHKYHHEWKAPCAMATFYCHPLEHYLVNLGPLLIGPILVRAHLSTAWLWYILALLSTTLSHSGYHLPFLPSSEAHDFHHRRCTQNYGSIGLLDWLHGTDSLFRSSPAYQQHFTLWGLTPAREIVRVNQLSQSTT